MWHGPTVYPTSQSGNSRSRLCTLPTRLNTTASTTISLAMKRKRVSCVKDDAATTPQCKRLQIESAPTKCSSSSTHTHPVLCRYYQRVLPLRAYLLGILPHTSRKRRRILEKFPRPASCGAVDELRSRVAQLLDNVLVGCLEQSHPNVDNDASQTRFEELSQSLSSFNNRLTFAKGKSMFWNDVGRLSSDFFQASSAYS